MSRFLILLALTLAFATAGHAQPAVGTVEGAITDQQNAVLPGVALTATSPTVPGEYRATSDALGRYRFVELAPGDYTITAELSGFARVIRAPVTVRAGLHVDLNIVMQVGAIGEVVE